MPLNLYVLVSMAENVQQVQRRGPYQQIIDQDRGD